MDTQARTLSLSGTWELSWQETGKGRFEDAMAIFLAEHTVKCPVPGDVHMALTQAGVIQEPVDALNSIACKWMEDQEFWYRKRFCVSREFLRDLVEITFEGLDTTADIWLNGEHLGSSSNAFVEQVFDITSCIRAGENELIVRIDDGVHAVKNKPVDLMRHSWNNEQPYRAWMRKPQFVYGWDWTVWLPTCGIWKDVVIRSYSRAVLRDVYIQNRYETKAICDASQIALWVSVETDLLKSGAYAITCEVFADDRYGPTEMVSSVSRHVCNEEPGARTVELVASIAKPQLWWPNGYGKPYLYTVAVSVQDETGAILHRAVQRHGIRSVSVREDILDEHSKSFTYVINGERIFCKGANHVPADCFPGRITPEKTRALLCAAAECNMNMIRVWGGGVYESECFMQICDELGLMVWHDFMFACGYYPDHDPDFYEEIRREATLAIRRLRKYSCLVGWSGNNEIQEMYHSVRQWCPEHPWYGGRIYEKLLPELVSSLCPDRIYRQSSPFGGVTPDSYDEGDQHTWHFTHRPAWEHYLDLWRFPDFDFKFLSEFGIIGAMDLRSARECIDEDALDPNSEQWRHHTNTSQDHSLLNVFVDTYFGLDTVRDLQDYILKSQVIQAEIMRHIYDELRSRKFRCSGVLLWTLSDSYGIHNWSVIDYYLRKRPVYNYLKRAMAPVNVAFRGYDVQCFDGMAGYAEHYRTDPSGIELIAANDGREDRAVTAEYQILCFDGRILKAGSITAETKANEADRITVIPVADIVDAMVPEETVLYVRVMQDGMMLSENHYFFAPYGKLRLQKPDVHWDVQQIGQDQVKLTLCSDTFVWLLHLQDVQGVTYGDNDFVLLPGQPRTVMITGAVADYVPWFVHLNP